MDSWQVSTHSRPKAAGFIVQVQLRYHSRFNTQPPEGGWMPAVQHNTPLLPFQHTAARRRLAPCLLPAFFPACFNTQPPEGGWLKDKRSVVYVF